MHPRPQSRSSASESPTAQGSSGSSQRRRIPVAVSNFPAHDILMNAERRSVEGVEKERSSALETLEADAQIASRQVCKVVNVNFFE